jgi:acetyl-CoA synthetase
MNKARTRMNQLLDDPDPRVRLQAARAIASYSPERRRPSGGAPRQRRKPCRARRAGRDLLALALEPALPARLLEPAGRGRAGVRDEWFQTKDAARQDEQGYFWYEGRADDVIIASGYRIGPFEVESACLEHPAVHEAAAIASPDELRGNVVKAFIILAANYEPSDELAEEIKAFVRARLSAYAYPRRLEFVSDLPKTLTGKIRRIELRRLELERTAAGKR